MRRRLMGSLLIFALAGLGVLGYAYFGKAESEEAGWTHAKSYDSLENIRAEADLVVRAHVPLYYDIREVGEGDKITRQAFYDVVIGEVFKDLTGHGFSEGSEIVVNQVIGMKDIGAADYSSDRGMKPMKAGDYILFLKKFIHPDGKVYYISNSSRHLYKWRGNGIFSNITSDELTEIRYSELSGES